MVETQVELDRYKPAHAGSKDGTFTADRRKVGQWSGQKTQQKNSMDDRRMPAAARGHLVQKVLLGS